jgi:hypothetical protein
MDDATDCAAAPDRDEFAALLMERIRSAGETAELHYDPEQFSLRSTGEGRNTFFLQNVYAEYRAAEPGRRTVLLRNFVRTWFTRHKDVPGCFEDAQPDLLPGVRTRAYFALTGLQAEVEGWGEVSCPHEVIGEHLAVGLVYDLPESIVLLGRHHLDTWGVPFPEALEAARDNLRQISRDPFDPVGEGVWRSPWKDNHDAARLVLPEVLEAHAVEGDLVAMVPNRDTLLLGGTEEGLGVLAELAEEALSHPRRVSGVLLRYSGGGWTPYLPPESNPLRARFRKMRSMSLGSAYAEQKELLDRRNEKTDEDVFVASYSAVQKKESGELFTYAVWSEGVETLLPEVDQVFFFRPGPEEEAGSIVGEAPWERVVAVVGRLLSPQGLYPERYRVEDFPTEQDFAALRAQG